MDTFTIIGPVFLLILLGYALGKTSLFKDNAQSVLVTYLWYVAIPAIIFRSIASADLPTSDEMMLVLGYYVGLYLVYALAMVTSKFIFKRPRAEQSVFAFSACFGNGVFIGIPIIEGVYGAEGLRMFLFLIAFHSSSMMLVSTIFIETGLNKDKSAMGILKETGLSFIKNPVMMSLFSALIIAGLQIPFPPALERIVALPAQSAAPVGLFTAGLALGGVKIAGDMAQAITGSIYKLLLTPLVIFTVTHYIMALPPMWVGVATLMAALPSGVIAYTFAVNYNTAPRRAASIIMISTVVSALTLYLLIEFFKAT